MATTKLLVKFRSYSKLVVTNDFTNLYDIVKTTYKAFDSFLANEPAHHQHQCKFLMFPV